MMGKPLYISVTITYNREVATALNAMPPPSNISFRNVHFCREANMGFCFESCKYNLYPNILQAVYGMQKKFGFYSRLGGGVSSGKVSAA